MSQSSPLSSNDASSIGPPSPPGPTDAPPSPLGALPEPTEAAVTATYEWMLEIADEFARIAPDLPADLAANHRYYRLARLRSERSDD